MKKRNKGSKIMKIVLGVLAGIAIAIVLLYVGLALTR